MDIYKLQIQFPSKNYLKVLNIKSYRLFIIILFFSVFIFSCDYNKADLFGKINKKYKNGSFLKMQDITDFEWDSMYVFKPGCELEYINTVLGFDYTYYKDIGDRIIFVKNKKVTYYEDKFPNPSPSSGDEILSFEFKKDTIKYICFDKKNAIFKVKKVKYKNVDYISLMSVK